MSKKLKLSPWHKEGVKPKHVGVYQKKYINDKHVYFSYWSGGCWGSLSITKEGARDYFYRSMFQDGKWRGVLK